MATQGRVAMCCVCEGERRMVKNGSYNGDQVAAP